MSYPYHHAPHDEFYFRIPHDKIPLVVHPPLAKAPHLVLVDPPAWADPVAQPHRLITATFLPCERPLLMEVLMEVRTREMPQQHHAEKPLR